MRRMYLTWRIPNAELCWLLQKCLMPHLHLLLTLFLLLMPVQLFPSLLPLPTSASPSFWWLQRISSFSHIESAFFGQSTLLDIEEEKKIISYCPGQGAQVVGSSSHAPKSCELDPDQGTCLGCSFDSRLGPVQEATDWWFSPTLMSLCLFLSLSPFPLSLNSINIPSGEDSKNY